VRVLRAVGPDFLQGILLSDTVTSVQLQASTAARIDVPADARYVHFSCGTEYFVRADATAALPTATVTPQSVERSPGFRAIPQGTTYFSVISASTAYLTAAFYG